MIIGDRCQDGLEELELEVHWGPACWSLVLAEVRSRVEHLVLVPTSDRRQTISGWTIPAKTLTRF
jgi:hypothetical protein